MAGKGSNRNAPDPARVWSLKDIQDLLDLLAGREITEFEMEQQGVKIRIRRGTANGLPTSVPGEFGSSSGFAVASLSASPEIPNAPASSPAPVAADPTGESTEGLFIMKSPLVGTFYGSPAPNAPSFVKVGDPIQAGQVLCIIEAMKLMNELEAEVDGRLVRAYVENGQPVEYGQSLFAIEPAGKKSS